MDQTLFNCIQRRFKTFLTEQKSPSPKKEMITEQMETSTTPFELRAMEQTTAFGEEDAPIGYRMVTTDKNGKQSYHIVAPK